MKKVTDDYEASAAQFTAALKHFAEMAIQYHVAVVAGGPVQQQQEEEEDVAVEAPPAAPAVPAAPPKAVTKRPREKPLPPSPFCCPGNLESRAPCATPTEAAHKTQVKHDKKLHFVCIKCRNDIVKIRKAAAPKKKAKVDEGEGEGDDEEEERA